MGEPELPGRLLCVIQGSASGVRDTEYLAKLRERRALLASVHRLHGLRDRRNCSLRASECGQTPLMEVSGGQCRGDGMECC